MLRKSLQMRFFVFIRFTAVCFFRQQGTDRRFYAVFFGLEAVKSSRKAEKTKENRKKVYKLFGTQKVGKSLVSSKCNITEMGVCAKCTIVRRFVLMFYLI